MVLTKTTICCYQNFLKATGLFPNLSIKKFLHNSIKEKRCPHWLVQPGTLSPRRLVPPSIHLPDYAQSGFPGPAPDHILIKTEAEIVAIKRSCSLAARILNLVPTILKPGLTTDQIDHLVHEACLRYQAYPSPLNYCNFPKSVCTSVNNVACHGIPDSRPLLEGDLVSVDVSVYFEGFHGDCCTSYIVGKPGDGESQRLVEVTHQCLQEAIQICRPGVPFRDIGALISHLASSSGFSVIPLFCGHGIGRFFHEAPQVFHDENDCEEVMEAGMIFTIEPVLSAGAPEVHVLEDGWTAVTCDHSRAAQFEHTLLITESRAEVLTQEVLPPLL